jgi:hypothetical protein
VLCHRILEGLHIEDGGAQQLRRVVRPSPAAKFDKGHHIATVSASGMAGFAAVDPSLKDRSDRCIETFDARFDYRSASAGKSFSLWTGTSSFRQTTLFRLLILPITEFIGSNNRKEKASAKR